MRKVTVSLREILDFDRNCPDTEVANLVLRMEDASVPVARPSFPVGTLLLERRDGGFS